MSTSTSIEWTDAATKTAAARIGIAVESYLWLTGKSFKWCGLCRKWHHRGFFGKDRSRYGGLSACCRKAKRQQGRKLYAPRPRPEPGRVFVPFRDGDRKQARRRVNYLVDAGLLPRPNDLPCADCGHKHLPGSRRHEYDHHLGYEPEHFEDVEVVCSSCHHRREAARAKD